jgi:hypothetical protein
MLSFGQGLGEYVCHIVIRMYVGVADYLAIVEISTVVVTNVDMLGSSFDDSSSDVSEIALVVAVNR